MIEKPKTLNEKICYKFGYMEAEDEYKKQLRKTERERNKYKRRLKEIDNIISHTQIYTSRRNGKTYLTEILVKILKLAIVEDDKNDKK